MSQAETLPAPEDATARATHAWQPLELALLCPGGQKMLQFRCGQCGLLRFEPLAVDEGHAWSLGANGQRWDGISSCREVLDAQAQTAREIVAARARAYAQRKDSGEEVILTQAERILAARKAADERTRKLLAELKARNERMTPRKP